MMIEIALVLKIVSLIKSHLVSSAERYCETRMKLINVAKCFLMKSL
jgi:hypothetical protein